MPHASRYHLARVGVDDFEPLARGILLCGMPLAFLGFLDRLSARIGTRAQDGEKERNLRIGRVVEGFPL